MKRQRGRGRRSGGGNNNNPNKHFESNGPDVKIRGSAQQILDKYLQYARDAQSSGDRVNAENYLQHAEHYYRVLAAMQPKEKPREDRAEATEDPSEVAGSPNTTEVANPDEVSAETAEATTSDDNASETGERRTRGRGRRRERPQQSAPEAVSSDAESAASDTKVEASETEVEAEPTEPASADIELDPMPVEDKPKPRRRTAKKKVQVDASSDDADEGIMKTLSRGRKKAAAEVSTPVANSVETPPDSAEPSEVTAEPAK